MKPLAYNFFFIFTLISPIQFLSAQDRPEIADGNLEVTIKYVNRLNEQYTSFYSNGKNDSIYFLLNDNMLFVEAAHKKWSDNIILNMFYK